MSFLAAISHRATLFATGAAAVVGVLALAVPTPPVAVSHAQEASSGSASGIVAPLVEAPTLDFTVPTLSSAAAPAAAPAPAASAPAPIVVKPAPAPTVPVAVAPAPVTQTSVVMQVPLPVASPNPPQPVAPAVTLPSAAPAPPQGLPAEEASLQLRQLNPDQLHARLELAFDRALPRLPDDGTSWLRFPVDAGDSQPVLIAGNRQTGEVRIVGRPEQLRAWREIVGALDSPPIGDRVTQLVSTDKAAAPHIKQTVGAIAAHAQPVAGQVTASGQAAGSLPAGAAELAMADGEGLLGPVQIEVVEGTDFFIIRGNPRDVERVMKVIEEIEEMSRVSEPQVVVRPLQHVDSQSMALITSRIFSPAAEGSFSLYPYYGPVLAVPLGKPNALLLVGSPTAVGKAGELLAKLDVGGGESLTQFETFRLKNAQAEQAQLVVSQLFVQNEAEAEGTAPPLAAKALVIAETRTNSLIVRASPRDMEEIRKMVSEIDSPGGEAVNEIRVFRLKNSMAAELAPVLQRAVRGAGQGDDAGRDDAKVAQLLKMVTIDAEGQKILASGVLAGVTVNADQRANTLIVSAPPESMSLMAVLIEQLDVQPDAVAELKVFTIENGDAVSLAEMLQSLFGTPDQGGGQGGQGGGGGAQSTAGSRVFQLRFSVDERTNSIIAAGSSDELLVVEAVLLRLDASDSRQRINRVYKLKNADAEQVALALQEWLQQKRDVEATAPGATSPFQQIEREVVIVAEINSNSLIVSATPSYYDEIADIIKQVDEEAPIVMIQVLIGEVTLGDIDEFGVEFGLQDSVLFDRSLLENIQTTTNTTTTVSPGGQQNTFQQQIIQSASMTPGFNFGDANQPLGNSGSDRSLTTAGNVAAQGLSSFGVGRVSQAAGFGGMVLSASSNSISMLLRALQQSQRLEVLSRPQIMALDNQTGRAFVGQVVPYITQSSLEANGARTNTVTFQDVGLELLVRPRISPDNLVVMEVFAAKSELGSVQDGVPISIAPNGSAINAPIINTISAETTISAVSGQTVVLSGLIVKRDRELHRRVPLLADIPLLGDLFRFDSKQVQKAELLIVLTPHVIRSRQQSEMLKQVESARMSWCLSDVVAINGPAGLRSANDTLGAAEAEAVFPTEVPNSEGRFDPAETIVTPGALPAPGNQPPVLAPTLAP
ncbi:secretin N-terminal domain-containing protein [Lacipirellula sp.]|uniref:secretin N-terminal domain-containing protein n=1 Tax=Lacipirellula sp. TaxID=2691419 RepID=UPI003D131EC8